MNKLEMGTLSTVRRSDGEVEDVPIRPTKPFFFSKVSFLVVCTFEFLFGELTKINLFDRSLLTRERKSRFGTRMP